MDEKLFLEHRRVAEDLVRRADETNPLGKDILESVANAQTPSELSAAINIAVMKGTGRYRNDLVNLRDIVKALG